MDFIVPMSRRATRISPWPSKCAGTPGSVYLSLMTPCFTSRRSPSLTRPIP